jgi:hypothetical protein
MPQAMPIEKTRGSTLEWSVSPTAAPYVLLGPRRLTSELQRSIRVYRTTVAELEADAVPIEAIPMLGIVIESVLC